MHDAGLPQGALASLGEAGARPAEAARAPRVRIQRRPVHGVLLLDKPLGLSSNDALQKAKWLLRAEKAGHTGTLDPLATGVLPLCFGAATKFSQIQLEAPKRYTAVARLGVTTSTGDAEGAVLERRAVDLGVVTALLPAVRERFLGLIQQVPPMHSALKKDGKALYEYARAGIEVEREPRTVHIHALDLRLEVLQDGTAQLHIDVACSKGTYIRTLGEDLGAALGCGAHLTLLRRTETGGIGLGGCVSLAALESMSEAERWACLQPVECLLGAYPSITLDEASAGRFLSGVRRRGAWADAPAVAVFGARPRALLGVGHVTAGELIPDRLLSPLEIQQILEGPPRLNASGTLETL